MLLRGTEDCSKGCDERIDTARRQPCQPPRQPGSTAQSSTMSQITDSDRPRGARGLRRTAAPADKRTVQWVDAAAQDWKRGRAVTGADERGDGPWGAARRATEIANEGAAQQCLFSAPSNGLESGLVVTRFGEAPPLLLDPRRQRPFIDPRHDEDRVPVHRLVGAHRGVGADRHHGRPQRLRLRRRHVHARDPYFYGPKARLHDLRRPPKDRLRGMTVMIAGVFLRLPCLLSF